MFFYQCDTLSVEFPQELVASKGGSRQIWQSFEMTRRPRARCGCHESCVENFQFSGVLCPSPRHLCTTPYIAHTPHVLCPRLSRVCIAMFRAHIYTARLVLVGVFLGEYSFGRFPICSRERRSMAMVVSALFIGVGSVQYCDGTMVQYSWVFFQGRQRMPHFFVQRAAATSPLAGSLSQTLLVALCIAEYKQLRLNARTLLSGGDPDQWLRWRRSFCPQPQQSWPARKRSSVLWDVYGWCGWRGPCSDNGEGF